MSVPSVEFFVALESRVWEALAAGDARADGLLLSEDFLGVYPNGFEGRSEHVAHLVDGPIVAEYEISSPHVRALADDTVLLAYRADHRPIRAGEVGPPETMFISSIWCRRGSAWSNVFSQDTPAA
jgi:hypothetical protein